MTAKKSNKVRNITLLALVGGVVFIAGILFGNQLFAPSSLEPIDIGGIYFDEADDLVEFKLIGTEIPEFTRDSLEGSWTFIYFGYTSCPDACPLTLAQLSKARDTLAEQNAADGVRYLLISVDPDRDSPERLTDYASSFGENFHAATGIRAEIDRLTSALGIYYEIHEPDEGDDFYLVDHSSALLLINPEAKLQAVFTPPFTPKQLATDFVQIRDRFDPTG